MVDEQSKLNVHAVSRDTLDAANPRKGGITGARMQEAELRALVPWAAALQAVLVPLPGRPLMVMICAGAIAFPSG